VEEYDRLYGGCGGRGNTGFARRLRVEYRTSGAALRVGSPDERLTWHKGEVVFGGAAELHSPDISVCSRVGHARSESEVPREVVHTK